jgi:uncharacterized delta-60 repeat protein
VRQGRRQSVKAPGRTRAPLNKRALFSCVGAVFCVLLAPALAQARPGDLDRSFADKGKAIGTFCDHERSFAIAIDGHHRLVVAGTMGFNDGFCLARYLPNGTLDASFGDHGSVVTQFGSQPGADSLAIDSRGRIVAGGTSQHHFALARYKPNGTLDPSFGNGGIVTTNFGYYEARSVAIDTHDRVVAAGWVNNPSMSGFGIVRFKRNGDLDPSFGGGGTVTTSFGVSSSAFPNSVKIDQRGRIVVGGYTSAGNGSHYDFALARYLPDGNPDDSFSGNGRVTTDIGRYESGESLAIDRHGRIVLGGGSGHKRAVHRFTVIRYRPGGTLDPSFGGDGVSTARFKDDAGANSIGIDSKGRIVATGGRFDVARFRTDGNLDHSFSGDGKASADWFALANSLAIDQRDRIDVVGWHAHLTLGRFNG